MNRVSATIRLGPAALLAAAVLIPVLAQAQSKEQIRAFCKDDPASLQQRINSQIANEAEREAAKLEIEARCAQIDLPSVPVHDSADAAREASHTDWIFKARYSRDGRTIVSAGRDGTVRLWDEETGKPIRRIVVAKDDPSGDEKGIVRSVTFVGDEKHVAAASDRNPVRLIELKTGNIVASFPVVSDGFGGTIAATSGGLLFIGGDTDNVDAIDTNTGAVRYRLPGHQMQASAIAISEKADLVATAASSQYAKPEAKQTPRVRLWRLSTGQKVTDFEVKGDPRPSVLAFSRDGAQLAIVSGGNVHIYSVADKRITQTLAIHPTSSPFDVAFTADGKGLITCIRHPVLWDLATAKRLRHFGPFTDLCHSIDISPDGRYALTTSAGSDLRIWEIATGTFYRRLGINVHPPY